MRMTIGIIAALFVSWLCLFSPANLDSVKANAAETWRQAGYEIIGYEGFQWGKWWGGTYGGAAVWHSLRRYPNDNGIIYSGFIKRWGDEYHIYGPHAIDAIKPSR